MKEEKEPYIPLSDDDLLEMDMEANPGRWIYFGILFLIAFLGIIIGAITNIKLFTSISVLSLLLICISQIICMVYCVLTDN